ncbi:hypothetical protein GOBAR_AA34072 [Gossypium barbadense]|uniref:Uncharacterized protein n=1 Tax=Gossypium barbadense TaxID=3634 RepID=A0A2P5W6B8_GOSBA|nr:hypothetical protein GOBAR_AA34072 [Gossypium barbadense]
MILERPQGSLPSNTETNPREQVHAITVRDEEGLVEPELELRQESVVSQGKVEVSHSVQKPISSDRVDYMNFVNTSNLVAQHSLQETPQKSEIKPWSSLYEKSRSTYEERMLKIDELDEWRSHVKVKLKIHDAEPKQCHDEHKDETKQFKVGDKVLIDKIDA